jgi:hypothetical protein
MFECALISYLSLCGGDSDGRLVGVVEPVWPWDAGDVTKVKVTKLEKVIFRFNKIYVILETLRESKNTCCGHPLSTCFQPREKKGGKRVARAGLIISWLEMP